MPPLRPPERLLTLSKEKYDIEIILAEELPKHSKAAARACELAQLYGASDDPLQSAVQETWETPWYENPDLFDGQKRYYYKLRYGNDVPGYGQASELLMMVTEPNPANSEKLLETKIPIIRFNVEAEFRVGETTSENFAVVDVVTAPNRALSFESDTFRDALDTLEFIAQVAAA